MCETVFLTNVAFFVSYVTKERDPELDINE